MTGEDVRRYALSLPETAELPHFTATSFRVRGKIFVTMPPDAAADSIHVFIDETQREHALALEPQCVEKLWWGKKVWGLRVALSQARPEFVERLILEAWIGKAPKRVSAAFGRSVSGRE